MHRLDDVSHMVPPVHTDSLPMQSGSQKPGPLHPEDSWKSNSTVQWHSSFPGQSDDPLQPAVQKPP